MYLRKVVVCVLFVTLLGVGAILQPIASAQAPEKPAIPVPAELKAEPAGVQTDAALYMLPAGTAYKDVMAQYDAQMTKAGWKVEKPAPDCPTGINSAAWSKEAETLMFAVFFLPADDPTGQAGLMTVLIAPPSAAPAGTEGAAAGAAPAECPCCGTLPAGKGGIWFENHIGEAVIEDIGPNKFEVPAKTGDTPGCFFAVVDPGKYKRIAKTMSAQAGGDMGEIEIVAGEILHLPLAIEGY
jgi:hypothetical protein